MTNTQQSKYFPDCFYRVAVKGLCVREGKVLLIHDYTGRSSTDPSPEWELPGGGLDFGASFADDLSREVQEEMGLRVAWMDKKPTYIWTTKHLSRRGMEWYWVLTLVFRFDLVDLNFTPSREYQEIQFFSREELDFLILS